MGERYVFCAVKASCSKCGIWLKKHYALSLLLQSILYRLVVSKKTEQEFLYPELYIIIISIIMLCRYSIMYFFYNEEFELLGKYLKYLGRNKVLLVFGLKIWSQCNFITQIINSGGKERGFEGCCFDCLHGMLTWLILPEFVHVFCFGMDSGFSVVFPYTLSGPQPALSF